MTPSERLIERLEGVKSVAPDRWIAKCPAHEDRSPSLSIRAAGDTALVHCFGGCDIGTVLAALNLELADLFPARPREARGNRPRLPYRDALELILRESMVLLIAGDDIAKGIRISDNDIARVSAAVGRIREICAAAGVLHG